jgi:hypothetical protein
MTPRKIAVTLAATALLLMASVLGVWAQLDRLANTTPQERARMQTEFMASRLGLTQDQTRAIGDLNLKYAQRMEPIIKGSEGPFMKLRQMREINEEKEAELKGILSPDQFQKYQASREEMRQKFQEWVDERRSGRSPTQ